MHAGQTRPTELQPQSSWMPFKDIAFACAVGERCKHRAHWEKTGQKAPCWRMSFARWSRKGKTIRAGNKVGGRGAKGWMGQAIYICYVIVVRELTTH